jgi:PPM family protein phosphatase
MQNPRRDKHLRSSARTSTGQVRENNEDNIHLWAQEDFVLAIVADGMGGAAAGEEASRMAVEAIESGLVSSAPNKEKEPGWQTMPDDKIAQKLRDVIRKGNLSIMERASNEPELRGMGTTITLAFVRGDHAIIAHVGDSRAYLVGGWDQTITQITADHSFVEALVAAGHITPEQADVHPMRNVLYRALGQSEDVDIDLYHTHMDAGDRLILCSDGLTRHVKANEICDLTLFNDDPDVASQKLIDLANARGGEDNVSVIIIKVEGDVVGPDLASAQGPNESDDTIVLRDKMPKIIPPAVLADEDEPTLREAPPMDDEEDTAKESPKDADNQVIPKRSDALDQSPPHDPEDTQGEGHDSRVPDQ